MKPVPSMGRRVLSPALLLAAAIFAAPWPGSSATNETVTGEIRIVKFYGKVEIIRAGATVDVVTQITNQPPLSPGDWLHTGTNSGVAVRLADESVVTFGASTDIEIRAPAASGSGWVLNLRKGLLYFFHRGGPGRARFNTPGGPAGIYGTEVVVEVAVVDNTERTTISVIDGEVRFGDGPAPLVLTNLNRAIAEMGKAPEPAPGFVLNDVNELLQWCFYYPAVLDLRDLPLTAGELQLLRESVVAYRSGDLLAALTKYPAGRQPGSDAERIYYAALLLSVGQVEQTETELGKLAAAAPTDRLERLASALRQLIAAVKLQSSPSSLNPELATEFLAASYYEQSRATGDESLKAALKMAKEAAARSPNFGFAYARVADLEFSFGRTGQARDALIWAQTFSPRNAQALALQGFLLAAQNKIGEAIDWFNRALAVDSALGNAWLGRGLCRIRRGDLRGGREDLLVAAALEPQRALLRSYLGKAFADAGQYARAEKEFQLAEHVDPNDPTAWLYSALLLQQQNRINEAVAELERSQELNDNRQLYRSGFLLDQDRAVRSANLALVYQDAGMTDWSVDEAHKAVAGDYANYSAHLFLANSYNALRDPKQVNLRYETPTIAEYLVANLLAPVGAGTLSPTISQQEYSKLFERDRFGLISSTEYSSAGDWRLSGEQYGTFGDFSYSLDAFYQSEDGQRPNNDLEQRQFSVQVKQQVSPQDSVYARVSQSEATGGDLLQYYSQASANPLVRTRESQEPLLLLGYHREWSPALHTLILAGRLDDTYYVNNPLQPVLVVAKTADTVTGVQPISIEQNYQSNVEIYSGELQQIWQVDAHQVVVGGRAQWGEFDTENQQVNPNPLAGVFPDPPELPANQSITVQYERYALYGYYNWRPIDSLQLVAGLSYDVLKFPDDYRFAPISNAQETESQLSPKAGIIWTPFTNTTFRGAYTRSLGGVSIDQSFQIEPSQVAGFNQLFRSLIPESVGYANAAASFETFGLALNQRFGSNTYLGLSGELLKSSVNRTVGTFDLDIDISDFAFISGTEEQLGFEEWTLLFTLDQLVGREWAFGTRYRLSHAQLKDTFVEMLDPSVALNGFQPNQDLESTLHQLEFHAIYNDPRGYFGQFQAMWNLQSNQGYSPALPGDDFWQLNLMLGYRFPKRRAVFEVGLLNLTDRDYRLNPLTLYTELPRERTLAVRLQFNF